MFSIVYGHSLTELHLTDSPWTGLIMGPFFDASAPCTTVLLFFFLSGWLQKKKAGFLAWRQFLFLAIPLLLWNLVHIIITWETDHYTIAKAITELGLWPTNHNANYVLWFLDDLAWFSLFLPLIHRIPIKLRLLFVLLALWIGNRYWPESWDIPKNSNSLALFVLGTVFHSLQMEKVTCFFKEYSWVATILAILYFYHPLFTRTSYTIPNAGYCELYGIAGCLFILSYGATAMQFFPRIADCIASCAPAVFFMYAAHVPAFHLYYKLSCHWQILKPLPQWSPIYTLVFMLLSIGIFKLATHICHRKLLAWIFLYKKAA